MKRSRTCLAMLFALVGATPLTAQVAQPSDDIVDRVVAIVGDSIVLQTQVAEEVERLRVQGTSIPTDPASRERLFRQVLDDLVNRLLVLRAASQDTLIQVDEERVDEIVNQELEQRAESFGGQPALARALQQEGLTLAAYREVLRSQVRQGQIQQMYVQVKLQGAPPAEVSEAEMLEAFQEARSQLQQRPRLLGFEQVVLAPASSESSLDAARLEAQQILDSIRAGGDFEELARAHSDDPGSAVNGGDLDWFRRGQMVREFEDAAFALLDGETSDLVETEFGFHIIRVERSRPGERKGRHILIRPELGADDVARARVLADSVADLARSGVPMAELFDRYSDPLAPDTLTLAFDQLDQLPPGYDVLRTAAVGDIVGPIEYDTGRGDTRLAVVRVREIREAGAYTFDDVKPQLAQQLQRTKQLEQLLAELRSNTHVEIRM